jgi:hypothetical protein
VSFPFSYALIGGIVCLRDDVWFYGLDWFVSLKWVLVYCGSYIRNNISCLVGFLFCTFHILANFLCFNSLEVLPEVSQRQMQGEEKKTSLYLPSHLVLAFVPPSSFWWRLQLSSKKKIEGFTPINKTGWPPTYFGSNVIVYLPPPCFFFLRISGRDSV